MRICDRFTRPPVGSSVTVNVYFAAITTADAFTSGNYSFVVRGTN